MACDQLIAGGFVLTEMARTAPLRSGSVLPPTSSRTSLPSGACVGAVFADVLAHRLQLAGERGECAEARLLAERSAGAIPSANQSPASEGVRSVVTPNPD